MSLDKKLKKENGYLKNKLKKLNEYDRVLSYQMNYQGKYVIKEKEYFKIHYVLSNKCDDFTRRFLKDIFNKLKMKIGLSEKQMNILIKSIKRYVPEDVLKIKN